MPQTKSECLLVNCRVLTFRRDPHITVLLWFWEQKPFYFVCTIFSLCTEEGMLVKRFEGFDGLCVTIIVSMFARGQIFGANLILFSLISTSNHTLKKIAVTTNRPCQYLFRCFFLCVCLCPCVSPVCFFTCVLKIIALISLISHKLIE